MDKTLKDHPGAIDDPVSGPKTTSLDTHISDTFGRMGDRLVAEFRKPASDNDLATQQLVRNNKILSERMLAVEDCVSALERQRSA
jgi:hypothetical protein